MLELKSTIPGKGGMVWLKADLTGAWVIQEDGTLGDLENSIMEIFAGMEGIACKFLLSSWNLGFHYQVNR